jgi:hypothetical protein
MFGRDGTGAPGSGRFVKLIKNPARANRQYRRITKHLRGFMDGIEARAERLHQLLNNRALFVSLGKRFCVNRRNNLETVTR